MIWINNGCSNVYDAVQKKTGNAEKIRIQGSSDQQPRRMYRMQKSRWRGAGSKVQALPV